MQQQGFAVKEFAYLSPIKYFWGSMKWNIKNVMFYKQFFTQMSSLLIEIVY